MRKLTLRRLSRPGSGSGGSENGSFFFGGEGGDLLGIVDRVHVVQGHALDEMPSSARAAMSVSRL